MPTIRHRRHVVPRRGNSPQALPTARVRAIFSGVIPWVSWWTIGATIRRCQSFGGGASGAGVPVEGVSDTVLTVR